MPRWLSFVPGLLLCASMVCAQSLRFDAPLTPGFGTPFTIESTSAFEIEAPFLPGGGQHETFTQRMEVQLKVSEASNTGAIVSVRVLSIEVDSESSLEGAGSFRGGVGGGGEADDASAVSKRYAGALTRAIGGEFVLVVDAQRTITAVRKPEGILKGMSRDERQAFERVLGADRLREVLQPVLRPVGAPADVVVGDEWTHTHSETTALGMLTFTSVHTLDAIDDATAMCAMRGEISINTQGLGRNVDVERDDYAGAIEWDLASNTASDVRTSVDLRYTLSEDPPIRASVTSSDRVVWTERLANAGTDAGEPQSLDDLLSKACARFGQPAIAAAVVNAEGIVAIGVAGERMKGSGNAVTIDDRWHLGSCTKAMTALLLARALADTEELTPGSTLSEVFPELAGEMHPRYRNATLADVLAHTAGLPAMTAGLAPDRAALRNLPEDPRDARAALARRLLTATDDSPFAPVNTSPAFAYSNAGYALASAVTERLLDAPWEALMRERLFAPLGMTTAGFGWPSSVDAQTQPRGHYAGLLGASPRALDDPYALEPAIDAAGDVHASIHDWARFAQDRLRALTGEDSALLAPGATLALMTPAEGRTYAGGWGVYPHPEYATIYAHDGSAGTFYSSVWIIPSRDVAVLVVTNAGTGAEACEGVRERLLERYASQ
ncbi:MAG: hypothetical protein Tsb0013_23730 [Phycisphaerales bacterium]